MLCQYRFVLIALFITCLWWLNRKPKQLYYYSEVTEFSEIERIAEQTLQKYPDAEIGKLYPELRYKVYSERYSKGEISKQQFDKQIDKILYIC